MTDRTDNSVENAPLSIHDDAEDERRFFRSSSLRVGLALARVILLYVLACWLVMVVGLQLRDVREQGWGLNASSTGMAEPGASPFGLPFVGVTVDLEEMSPAQRAQTLDRLSDHGVGWVRQRFDWNTLEPTPGAFDWQKSDAMLASIVDSGLTPIVVLDGSPAWARRPQDRQPTDNPLAPPADPATFARFAAAFAQRYGHEVKFYQLWDEPNIAPHWGNQHVEPTAYAHLLIEAAQAVRIIDDDAVIIAAALAPTTDRGHTALDEVTFLQRMYATGVQPHVDMMAIQPFGFGYSAQDPKQRPGVLNFQRTALVRRAMVAAGDDSTPLLITRYGWNSRPASPWRTVEPDAQQAYLNNALDIAWRRWPWIAGIGWAIDQPGAPESGPIWGFALDDSLLATIDGWTADASGMRPGYKMTVPWGLLLATAALAVVGWRMSTVLRILPWATWQTAYRGYRPWIKILLWAFLLLFYHIAAWPPLILFLLAAASILIAMQPQVGLWLAAALLPFHFLHKEFHLVNTTLLIPPAQAAVLASLPAIVLQIKSVRSHKGSNHVPGTDQELLVQQNSSGPSPAHSPRRIPTSLLVRQNLASHRVSTLRQRLQPLDWYGFGWLGISLLTMVNTWHWPAYWTGLLNLVAVPLLLYWMVRLFATERTTQTRTAIALFAGGVLVAVFGLTDWFAGGGTEADAVRRLTAFYFSPNHAALYLERSIFLGMGLFLFWKTDRRRRIGQRSKMEAILILTAIAGIGAALLLTASRGALLLGLPVGLVLFFWLDLLRRGQSSSPSNGPANRHRAWMGAGVATITLTFIVLALVFWPRLSNTATIAERFGVWQASWALWQSMPILGSSPGGFYWQYPAFIPIGSGLDPNLRHPHNIWLESLTLWGAVGLTWLILGMAWAIRTVWRERHILGRLSQGGIIIGLLAGLAAGIAHGQVDTFGALADLAAWNWLALGLWRAMAGE